MLVQGHTAGTQQGRELKAGPAGNVSENQGSCPPSSLCPPSTSAHPHAHTSALATPAVSFLDGLPRAAPAPGLPLSCWVGAGPGASSSSSAPLPAPQLTASSSLSSSSEDDGDWDFTTLDFR